MKQETIDKIRRALKQATKWTCVPDPTCIYVPVGKLHWQEVRPPDAMLPSLPAACLLLDHAPELLDEIERLTGNQKTCRWHTIDEDEMPGTYKTECDHIFSFCEGDRMKNNAVYCQYCGGKIEEDES